MKILHYLCRSKIYGILIISLIAFLAGNGFCDQPQKRDYWPTEEWKTSTPGAQGMDPAKLAIADKFVNDRLPDALSLMVIKNGYLVFEKYYSFGSPYRSAAVHSVTKSVTSALIGIALDKGYLTGVDQKLSEFFPEYFTAELDPRTKEITLEHILTMSAGFQWDDRGSVMTDWYFSGDWPKFTIQLPQENAPGDVFTYNSSISHLLSIILSKATKTSTLDFAKKNLFDPLGIRPGIWRQDTQGNYIGGFGLSLTMHDLAKIGFLYLNNGFWDGHAVVPESWVKESTQQKIQAMPHPFYGEFGYGYQWWVKKIDGVSSFRAWGRRGQYIVVVPELDLVIAVTSKTTLPHPGTSIHYSPLFDLIAASVNRVRPPKKILKAVELPTDVKEIISNTNQATNDKDMVAMADLMSDRFLHNGVNKAMAIKFLSHSLRYTPDVKIIVTKYGPKGDKALLDVYSKDEYFEAPFMIGSALVKEEGQWKWYGNQVPR